MTFLVHVRGRHCPPLCLGSQWRFLETGLGGWRCPHNRARTRGSAGEYCRADPWKGDSGSQGKVGKGRREGSVGMHLDSHSISCGLDLRFTESAPLSPEPLSPRLQPPHSLTLFSATDPPCLPDLGHSTVIPSWAHPAPAHHVVAISLSLPDSRSHSDLTSTP